MYHQQFTFQFNCVILHSEFNVFRRMSSPQSLLLLLVFEKCTDWWLQVEHCGQIARWWMRWIAGMCGDWACFRWFVIYVTFVMESGFIHAPLWLFVFVCSIEPADQRIHCRCFWVFRMEWMTCSNASIHSELNHLWCFETWQKDATMIYNLSIVIFTDLQQPTLD